MTFKGKTGDSWIGVVVEFWNQAITETKTMSTSSLVVLLALGVAGATFAVWALLFYIN